MILKTIFNANLLPADSYTVECGSNRRDFPRGSEKQIGEWVRSIWDEEIFPSPAYVYKNIGWDSDHVLYCKYEKNPEGVS